MSYFQGMNPAFANPSFGIDLAGKFGQVGSNLENNPFGGPSLNIGGFDGSTPGYGGADFGGFNKMDGLLALAGLGQNFMAMNNTNRALQGAYDTAQKIADSETGKNIFAQNKDIFDQKNTLAWASKFKMNDPSYRQLQARQALLQSPTRTTAWLA